MENNGAWVKFYDKFWKSEVASTRHTGTLALAIWLLSHARRTDGWFKRVRIPRGSVAYSERGLASELGMSHRQMRTARDNTTLTQFATYQTTHHFLIASICNFNKYQTTNGTPKDTRPTHDRHTTDTTYGITIDGDRRRKKEKEGTPSKDGFEEMGKTLRKMGFPSPYKK